MALGTDSKSNRELKDKDLSDLCEKCPSCRPLSTKTRHVHEVNERRVHPGCHTVPYPTLHLRGRLWEGLSNANFSWLDITASFTYLKRIMIATARVGVVTVLLSGTGSHSCCGVRSLCLHNRWTCCTRFEHASWNQLISKVFLSAVCGDSVPMDCPFGLHLMR